MIHAAVIGDTYYMGNTFNPEECKVTHLVGYADLPERVQRTWYEIGKARNHNPERDGFVCFTRTYKHGHAATRVAFLPLDVFCACAHESFEAMVSDRARADQVCMRGLPGAVLPGEV